MHACGADPEEFRALEFHSSHEALLLDYEWPLTRIDVRSGVSMTCRLICCGSGSAPVLPAALTLSSRVRSAIRSPSRSARQPPSDVLALIEALDPDHEPGRLTLITRMGARRIRQALPPLVEKAASEPPSRD